MRQIRAGCDDVLSLAPAVSGGNDGGKDCCQPDSFLERRFDQGLGCTLCGDDSSQHVHRVGRRIQRHERPVRRNVEVAPGSHLLTQSIQLRLVRQLAVPKEVRDLFETDGGGEVFDEVTVAIDKAAIGPVHLADGRLSRDHSLQPWAELRHRLKCREARFTTTRTTTKVQP